MDSDNSKSYEEIFADNLSACSSVYSDNYDTSEEEELIPTKILELQFTDSEESNDEEDDGVVWSKIDNPPNIEPFLGHPGICVEPLNNSDIEAVKLFIDDDLFEMMVEESNRYYEQNKVRFKEKKKSVKWKPVDLIEMKKFIGLILLMGQVKKETRDDYWSTDFSIETPIFAKTMSRDRFNQIWGAWHFANNDNIKHSNDRLSKIKPILNYLVPKFSSIYKPKRELSLDEGIIPWRGRLSFKVYNAAKVLKYGTFVRMVCEATTGYICNLEIYSGRGKPLLETIQSLLVPHLNIWHHLYMNNFYNNVKIGELLLQHKIRTCGTIRLKRGLPQCFHTVKLGPRETFFRRRNDVLLQQWKSKKDIRMISTIHSSDMVESRNIDWKPRCVVEHNKYMKGVERADQYLSYFSTIRATKKWTIRVVIYLLNCALFNSFIVYKALNSNKKLTYRRYLRSIGKCWITDQIPKTDIEPVPSTSQLPRKISKYDHPGRLSMDMNKHQAIKIETGGKKKIPQRQCRVCSRHKKKSLTSYMCKFCDVPLHRDQCFVKYHTLVKY